MNFFVGKGPFINGEHESYVTFCKILEKWKGKHLWMYVIIHEVLFFLFTTYDSDIRKRIVMWTGNTESSEERWTVKITFPDVGLL